MTCEICGNTGYRMVDIGTATIPDYIEARCACNPEPTDFDYGYDDCGVPAETPYPADFDVPVADFDKPMPPLRPDPSDYWLPAHLLG